jgi:hypothetical protein
MKVKMIRYCCYGAHMDGESSHPQAVMKTLGITYQHSTPQSMAEQWWFWIPENLPDLLPKYITVTDIDPMSFIGFGLDDQTAKRLAGKL